MSWRPLVGREGPGPRRVGDSLVLVTRALGGPEAEALVTIISRWATTVGPTVAAHAHPVRLSAGTLTVAVDQPGWATQITWLQADLCRRLEGVVGAGVVTSVAVSVRPR